MLNRKFINIFIGTFLAVFFCSCGGLCASSSSSGVFLVDKSKVKDITANESCFETISNGAAALLEGATDAYMLSSGPKFMESLAKSERGVKVIFQEGKKVNIGHFSRTVIVKEIYIPLTGRFASNYTTIFFAAPTYDTANQYINVVDKKIRAELDKCAGVNYQNTLNPKKD